MNILFTVCGRAGSKGLKNKNLKDLLGYPLVYYTLSAINLYMERFAQNNQVDICLSTDSPELIALAKKQTRLDIHIIKRTDDLCGDQVAKRDVICDCLNRTEETLHTEYEMVVDLDITSPLRTADDIDKAISQKRLHPDADVVFSVTEARRNPYFNMVKQEGLYYTKVLESNFTTRQQAPQIYDMNASIYVYESVFLRNRQAKMLFDGKCSIIEMMDTAVLDIDSEKDFELMEWIASYFLPRNLGLRDIRDSIPQLFGAL